MDHEMKKQAALQRLVQELRSLSWCPTPQSLGLEGRMVKK